MEELRNVPMSPTLLADLIDYQPNSVVSMSLSKSSGVDMTLFAFDEGDSVSSEYYLGDTLYLVLEGSMPISWDGKNDVVTAGGCIAIPARVEHAIGGEGPFKLLQITPHPAQ